MSGFSDSFPDDVLMNSLGDDIVYMPSGGGSYSIKAIVDKNVERVGDDGYTVEHRTEVEFLLDAIPVTPAYEDTISYKSNTYTVIAEISNDGAYIRLAVR